MSRVALSPPHLIPRDQVGSTCTRIRIQRQLALLEYLVVTVTAGRDSSRCRYQGNNDTPASLRSAGLRMLMSYIDTIAMYESTKIHSCAVSLRLSSPSAGGLKK